MIYLENPMKYLVVTFPFGALYPESIKKYGLKYHLGVDWRTDGIKPVSSPLDGYVSQVTYDKLGGNMIRITSDEHDGNIHLEVRFAHLSKVFLKEGDKVIAGDPIAMSGNTGSATTAQHLHMDVKKVLYNNGERSKIINYDKKLFGCVDPAHYLHNTVGYCEHLPVDEHYGQKRSWWLEFKIRFKIPWLHRRLQSMGRKADSITNREVTALSTGRWGVEEVFDPSMFAVWSTLTKMEYQMGKKPEIRLIR